MPRETPRAHLNNALQILGNGVGHEDTNDVEYVTFTRKDFNRLFARITSALDELPARTHLKADHTLEAKS